MTGTIKEALWKQFGAAIDMLENAITACPSSLWNENSQFWYKAYHTIFYLDYYLSDSSKVFQPPSPFTCSELDPEGALPDRVYSKEELLYYLKYGRRKFDELILAFDTLSDRRFKNDYHDYGLIEILLYNMRHVQHHTGQLNTLLRQHADLSMCWVSESKPIN